MNHLLALSSIDSSKKNSGHLNGPMYIGNRTSTMDVPSVEPPPTLSTISWMDIYLAFNQSLSTMSPDLPTATTSPLLHANGKSLQEQFIPFWPWQMLLIITFSVTALLSLTLNLVTIYVLLKSNKTISKELWKLLVSLSAADIGMALFCIPFTYSSAMLGQWMFPHALCPLVHSAQLLFVFISVWTLTAIGIDR